MRRMLNLILSPLVIILAVTVILSLCLWFFGPFLSFGNSRPLDSVPSRAIGVAVLWALAILTVTLILLRRRSRDRRLADEILDTGAATDGSAVTEEMADLRDKLREALTRLRKSKLGRRHLYQLPWYIVIGPPGAGKTTAIVNSGLQFPLAGETGKGPLGGVGGTRNCDWWFTNDAVIIDTAGRYTTHESDAAADSSAWAGFLGLLKKYRKRQPINGAVVAISLADLSMQDEVTQMSHARAVRQRLHELRDRLGVRFPVYVLFTKADLIAGFTEFFDDLGKEEREQVWGFTLPIAMEKAESSPVASVESEFDGLLAALNAQSLEKMQGETDHQRRSLIAGFPNQFASLRQISGDFLREVFQDSRYEDRHMLRGVYFTSGTQEGTPIDRLMMGMARTFGIGRQAMGSGQGTGRSFFLTRLMRDVIFPEAGLVSADDRVERRVRWIRRAAVAATILTALGVGALWTRSFIGNREMVARATAEVADYRAAAGSIPGDPIGDTDIPAVVPALNILRDMPGNPAVGEAEPPPELRWGLYQGDVIGTQAAQAYRVALNRHFLPRLLLRLEEQIQSNMNNGELLYEALKIYLILGLQGPMDERLVKDWMEIDWSLAYPGDAREQLRADLSGHLAALLDQPMQQIALNGPLVEQVQEILAAMPLSERVYNGIVNSQAAKAIPQWRLTEVGGPAVARVLVRSSGKPLSEGIEGIFTRNGFNDTFLGEALQVAQRVQRESWVLGPLGEAEQSEQALAAISRDVLNLYYNDYIQAYDFILGDIDIIPLQSLSHAVEVTNVLSGPTSPIVNILNAVNDETRLSEERGSDPAADAAGSVADAASGQPPVSLGSRNRLLLNALMAAAPLAGEAQAAQAQPGAYVQERFDWLNTLVARPDGQPSQLDMAMTSLQEVYVELNRMAINSGGALPQPGEGSALQRFQQEAGRLPGPLQRWSTQIGAGSSGITAEGTRAQLNALWQSQILPFCQTALTDRYPFSPRSQADMAVQDFTRLFAPDGMIDGFVNENLLPYVDRTTRPWTWKPVNGAELGLSPAVLEQFQNASDIRDAFFAGADSPQVAFQMKPYSLDPQANRVILEIDGQQVSFQQGEQATPVAVRWPGPVGLGRISFEPKAINAENSLSREGPWALRRLLDAAEMRAIGPDQTRVIFRVGGRLAIFDMRSGTALNPFTLSALTKFSCPASL